MPFEAGAEGERLTIAVKRYVFNLVVVYDVRLSSSIREGIELLFAGSACARDHGSIDDLELTVALLAALDKESSVIQLRLRRPCDHRCASRFVAAQDGNVKVQQVAVHRHHNPVFQRLRRYHTTLWVQ